MIIDFHSHILPGVDHGCHDLEESKKQLKMAFEEGIDVMVSTSHFYPHSDTVESFLLKRNRGYQEVKDANLVNVPKILLGAEVLACKGMEKMEKLELLCVEGTDIMLLELPIGGQWSAELVDTIFKIEDQRNIRVVLAHVERYPYNEVMNIISKGICAQINADYICSFGNKKILKESMKHHNLVAIGSDIHGTDKGFKTFHKARKILGNDNVELIMKRSARLLLQTEELGCK